VSRTARPGRTSLIAISRKTFKVWSDHDAGMHAAAISFFAIFSIAPVLILIIWIAHFAFNQEAVQGRIVDELGKLMGQGAANTVEAILRKAASETSASLAGAGGLVAVLAGATAMFLQLQSSLNRIWDVEREPETAIRGLLRKRLLSFGLVVAIGFLLLVSLALSAAITALADQIGKVIHVPLLVLDAANLVASIAVFTALFALMFRFLPDVELPWEDVGLGGLVTALLMTAGKWGISLYLGHSAVASTFGAAASLVVILLWIYYAAMIVLFGAAFTRVWSEVVHGRELVPEKGARRVVRVVENAPRA
jgi:membrane protein